MVKLCESASLRSRLFNAFHGLINYTSNSKKFLAFGILIAFSIIACASFPYKYYGIELADYSNGKLLGPSASKDLPIAVCEPDQFEKGKCVVFLIDEFERLQTDLTELRSRLKACEEGR